MRNVLSFLLRTFMLMAVFISCNDDGSKKKEIQYDDTVKKHNAINVKDSLAVHDERHFFKTKEEEEFYDFVKNFKERKLPYELSFSNNDWIDFTSQSNYEIPRDTVVKYICGNVRKGVIQPGGGYHQYYYGYQVDFHDSIIGLIYYKTSLEYTGYLLSLFNTKGKVLGEMFLAGTKGEYDIEAQKEAQIFENGNIEIKEIILNKELPQKTEPYDAKIIRSNYKVSSNGELIHLKDSVLRHKNVYQDRDRRYRLFEKE